jgi:hypothetical protein
MTACRHCRTIVIADDHGTLIDATDGDVCAEHGDDLPHEVDDDDSL